MPQLGKNNTIKGQIGLILTLFAHLGIFVALFLKICSQGYTLVGHQNMANLPYKIVSLYFLKIPILSQPRGPLLIHSLFYLDLRTHKPTDKTSQRGFHRLTPFGSPLRTPFWPFRPDYSEHSFLFLGISFSLTTRVSFGHHFVGLQAFGLVRPYGRCWPTASRFALLFYTSPSDLVLGYAQGPFGP